MHWFGYRSERLSALVDSVDADLTARIEELEERLERERARSAGLERGIDALSARVEELRLENALLRGDD